MAGDFDGDGRDELVVYNSTLGDPATSALIKVATDGSLRVRPLRRGHPRLGRVRPNDKFLVGDFNGDGKDDLSSTTSTDWVMPYVATLMSTGSGFTLSRRYDGDIPGWGGLARHDQILVGDFAGTGRTTIC